MYRGTSKTRGAFAIPASIVEENRTKVVAPCYLLKFRAHTIPRKSDASRKDEMISRTRFHHAKRAVEEAKLLESAPDSRMMQILKIEQNSVVITLKY
jgi:hypothetical protein